MLIQNHKIINRLNRNKDSFRIADNDFNSSITDALPMTQRSPLFLSTLSFSASHDWSPFNKIVQREMFTDKISNEVTLRKLKEAIINEYCTLKLSCSIQTKSQLKAPLLFTDKKLNYLKMK